MTSSNIFLVFILCIIFCSIPTVVTKDDETTTDSVVVDQIPGLDILKEVEIRKDGRITSLSKMFGPHPAEWSVDDGSFRVVTDMCLTAQCCVYCSQIMNFMQTIEGEFDKCEKARKEIPRKNKDNSMRALNTFIACLDETKLQFKSWLASSLKMLMTAMNFAKKFNLRADKNALNAIMSFYLFVNGIQKRKSTYNTAIPQKHIEREFPKSFFKMRLYTRNLIESFAVWNCSWTSFDDDRSNKTAYGDHTTVYQFALPDTYFKHTQFKSEILFLKDITEYWFNRKHTIGDILVQNHYILRYLQEYHKLYADTDNFENKISEDVTKSQSLMFQSIALICFYFINGILEDSRGKGIMVVEQVDDTVTKAIDVLSHFNFPGLLHVKMRSVLYQRTISIDSDKALSTIFKGTQFGDMEISELVEHSSAFTSLPKVTRFVTHLEKFTNYMIAMESDIKAVSEINENLCDYEFEEVGFWQYDACTAPYRLFGLGGSKLFQVKPTLLSLKQNNCQFSIVAVIHFMLNDFILTQCDSITFDANNLNMCLDSMKNAIVSIEETLDYALNNTIKILDSVRPFKIGNRKLIDSILAMKLYFSNGNLLNSNVPLTEQGSVDMNGMVSKLDTLKRSHRFIINLIENYTVIRCPTPSTREEFTNSTNVLLYDNCGNLMNSVDKKQLIECVKTLTVNNLNSYTTDKTQMNRNNYTVESLLMTNILNKALINDSSFSMLYDLHISWDGNFKRLPEIIEFVKHNINPKYLSKYQLTIIKATVFIAYEHMKTLIDTSYVNDNYSLYSKHKENMFEALTFVSREYFPLRLKQGYNTIFEYFKDFFLGDFFPTKINPLIHIIEVEQYYLGLQKEPSDIKEDDLILSLPDHVLKMTSDIKTVVQSDSKMDTDINDGQTNLNRLLTYSADIDLIWHELLNILRLLDSREVTDVTIQ